MTLADPNGSAVARIRADGTGEPEILHQVAPGRGLAVFEMVSVDGRPTLLAGVEGKGIVLMSIEGDTKMTTLVDEPWTDFDATVSPDGRCLAYVSVESGRPELYLRPFPSGSGRTQVSNEGARRPLWSHDGRLLLYTPPDAPFDASRRVAVATRPGDCLTIPKGTPTPMPAPPGERVLETRDVDPPEKNLDVIAIQGWAGTLTLAAP